MKRSGRSLGVNSANVTMPIDFIEGFNPGNNSLFARARDPVAISLLQARLTELETGLEIVPIEEYEW